jgi:N-acetylglucosamine-6-sulfatase
MGSALIGYAENSYRSRIESLLAVDDAVAAIVGALKAAGELDDTLIVFVSDNGFFTGEHRIPMGKYLVYEPSVRVPLILRGPGVRRGATSSELVVNTDLAATILDAAGATPGRRLDGRSLLSFARHPRRRTARPILLETGRASDGDLDQDGGSPPFPGAPDVPPYQAVRTRRYLYVEYADGARELYDLARDPAELDSRHDDPRYARTRRALAAQLDAIRTCKGSSCRAPGKPIRAPR